MRLRADETLPELRAHLSKINAGSIEKKLFLSKDAVQTALNKLIVLCNK